METQVQKLKLNVTNIKSYLISSNKTLSKLKRQKKNLTLNIIKKNQQQKEETTLETKRLGIGSGFLSIAGAVSRPAMGIFDKIMEFFGLIALGFLIKSLPAIINKINEFLNSDFFKAFTGFIKGFIGAIKGLIDLTTSLSKSVRNNFVKGYNKAIKDVDNFINLVSGSVSIFNSWLKGTQNQNQQQNQQQKQSQPAKTPTYGRSYKDGGDLYWFPTDKDGNPINPLPRNVPSPQTNPKGWGPVRVQQKSSGGTIKGGNTKKGESEETQPAFTFRRTGVGKKAQRDADTGFAGFSKSVDGINDVVNKDSENVEAFKKMLTNWSQLNSIDSSSKSPRTPRTPPRPRTPGLNIPITTQGVSTKEVIGYLGSTGNSTGPHIHIEQEGIPYNTNYTIPDSVKRGILIDGIDMITALYGPEDGNDGIGWSQWRNNNKGRHHHGEDFGGVGGEAITLKSGFKFIKYVPNAGLYGNKVYIQAPNGNVYSLSHLESGPPNPQKIINSVPNNNGNLNNPGGAGGGPGLRLLNRSMNNQSVFIYAVQPVQSYVPFPVPMPMPVSVPSSNSGGKRKTPSIWRG